MIRVFLEQAVGIAAILGILYWWTGLPEGTGLQVAISFGLLFASLAAFGFLARRGIRNFRQLPPLGTLAWLAALGYFLVALRTAYSLVWWVPEVQGFTAQAFSMTARFGLAYLAVTAGWTGLLRAIASGIPRSSQASTAGRP